MATTTIRWATHVWNPFTGCDRVSPGCARCYAATAAASLKRRGNPRYQNDGDPKSSGPGFGFTVHWDKLRKPEQFPKGARVFVNSMSDVFHEEAPTEAIQLIWKAAAHQPWAKFLILTKRAERMRDHLLAQDFKDQMPLPNVWLGVSIENRRFIHRADLLRETPAAVRFISAEPLLSGLVTAGDRHRDWHDGYTGDELDLDGIDWLIVGGESGANRRPLRLGWVRDLRDAALASDTSFFFKQGSAFRPDQDRELDGRTWDEIPDPAVVA